MKDENSSKTPIDPNNMRITRGKARMLGIHIDTK